MQGRMWVDAKNRFEGQNVRLFVSGLTTVMGDPEGRFSGMWTFYGKVSFGVDYVIIGPGTKHELWIQNEVIDAISLDDDEEDEEDEPDWDKQLRDLQKGG